MKLDKAEFNQLRYLYDKYKVKERELIEVLCNKLVKSYENIDDKFKGYGSSLNELHERAKVVVNNEAKREVLLDDFELSFKDCDPDEVRLTATMYDDHGYPYRIGRTFKLDD